MPSPTQKPIGEFTTEDLRIMIGQDIGTVFLVPLALEKLAADPLAEGNCYPGDLLCSVLNLPGQFWQRHSGWRSQLEAIIASIDDPSRHVSEAVSAYRDRTA